MSPAWNPMDAASPWLTFSAIQFLERYLRPNMAVFEYGAGGSTLFLARRVGRLYSVEHDQAFADAVRGRLRNQRGAEARMEVVVPTPVAPGRLSHAVARSAHPGYEHLDFSEYVRRIRAHEDRSLDVVLVDGRARVACLREAQAKVKPSGILVLDNAERPEYAPAQAQLLAEGWRAKAFRGLGPKSPYPWLTTVFAPPAPAKPRVRVTRLLMRRLTQNQPEHVEQTPSLDEEGRWSRIDQRDSHQGSKEEKA